MNTVQIAGRLTGLADAVDDAFPHERWTAPGNAA
jgi:hypothetical protein